MPCTSSLPTPSQAVGRSLGAHVPLSLEGEHSCSADTLRAPLRSSFFFRHLDFLALAQASTTALISALQSSTRGFMLPFWSPIGGMPLIGSVSLRCYRKATINNNKTLKLRETERGGMR